MTTNELRRCSDCYWSIKPFFSPLRCQNPEVCQQFAACLTGDGGAALCTIERKEASSIAPCGKAGKLWEPK